MNQTRSAVNRSGLFVLLSLLVLPSVLAQTRPSDHAAIAAKVDAYLNAAMKFRRFGGSVLIARGGQPLVDQGYGTATVNADCIDMSTPFSAGALYSTTEDLLRWDHALYRDRLVSRKSLEEIYTPFKDNYGYGWGITKQFNRVQYSHSGRINGFSSYIARYPEGRLTVIVLCNHQDINAAGIGRDLAAIVFEEPYQIPQEQKVITLAPSVLDSYAGQYKLPSGVLIVTDENGRLMMVQEGMPESKRELFAKSEADFFFKGQ